MKNLNIVILTIMAFCIIGCSSGSSSSSGGSSDSIITLGGVSFNTTKSDAAPASLTSGYQYHFTGGGFFSGTTMIMTYDDGYTSGGVPCILQTVATSGSIVSEIKFYLAEGTNGNVYVLQEDTVAYTTPQIEYENNLTIDSVWTAVDLDSETTTSSVFAFDETTPNGGWDSQITIFSTTEGISGSYTIYSDNDLIPIELSYEDYDGITGYFTATASTLTAPSAIN